MVTRPYVCGTNIERTGVILLFGGPCALLILEQATEFATGKRRRRLTLLAVVAATGFGGLGSFKIPSIACPGPVTVLIDEV